VGRGRRVELRALASQKLFVRSLISRRLARASSTVAFANQIATAADAAASTEPTPPTAAHASAMITR